MRRRLLLLACCLLGIGAAGLGWLARDYIGESFKPVDQRQREQMRNTEIWLTCRVCELGRSDGLPDKLDSRTFKAGEDTSSFWKPLRKTHGRPRNPFTGDAIREVSPSNPSAGNFSYIPLQQITYRPDRAPEVTIGSYLLLYYEPKERQLLLPGEGAELGWLAQELHCDIEVPTVGCFLQGPVYDSAGELLPGNMIPGGKSGGPQLIEDESLSTALRRLGYVDLAERLEAAVPNRAGRHLFFETVAEQWPKALKRRDYGLLRLMPREALDLNAPLVDGQPALVWMAAALDSGGVEWLLDFGADINVQDPATGNTPLLAALLILHSSDPKLISDADFLASADSGARRQVVEYLLKRGADPGIANKQGQTARELQSAKLSANGKRSGNAQ